MSADPRDRHLRRLHRRRRGARRWTVLAATFGGAAAVLVPYAGLGAPDAGWAAAAGGSAVLAVFRWLDYRRMVALPVPDPLPPGQHGGSGFDKLLRGHPLGRSLAEEVRRTRDRLTFRDSAAASAWQRLDQAARAMPALAERLPSAAADSVAEALAVETLLRDLAHRVVDVERGLLAVAEESAASLRASRDALVEQLTEGVAAYERLVAAAAECVAEGVRDHDDSAVQRLNEATDRLVALATGFGELRDLRTS